MKRFFLITLLIIMVITLISCVGENQKELEVFYTEDFIKGTVYIESSVINYDIEIPVITNKELKDINLDASYGNDFQITNLSNRASYKGKFVKVLSLKINQTNVNSNFKVEQLKLTLTSIDDEVKEVTLPLDLNFIKSDNQTKLDNFSSLKRIPIVFGLNIPRFGFALNPSIDHSILIIETSEEVDITHVKVGKSLTDDFNEVNDQNLTDIDFNHGSVFMQANYNTYFEVGIEYLNSSYIFVVFTTFITLRLDNDEEFRTILTTMNGVSILNKQIYNYIEENFKWKKTLDQSSFILHDYLFSRIHNYQTRTKKTHKLHITWVWSYCWFYWSSF